MGQMHAASSQLHTKIQQTASTANPKIDFLALEAKWLDKWHDSSARLPRDNLESSTRIQPLTPFYLCHLRKPTTILETLAWHYGRIGGRGNKEHTALDRIIRLSEPQNAGFESHIRKYGADVIRTSLLFGRQAVKHIDINETDIEKTRQWFESIWQAISLAHDSYITTQGCSDIPDVPEALYEPDIESWVDHIAEEHLRWVQVPPKEPEVSTLSADGDTHRLWLVAQEAIIAFSAPTTARNSIQAVKSRLMRLTMAIIAYDDACEVDCNMHYYSARVLISLVAPSAPAFAEECWVLLHYGRQDSNGVGNESRCDEMDEDELDDDVIEMIIKEAEDDLGRHRLPRQGLPDTLQSIFDQPFPKASRLMDGQRTLEPRTAGSETAGRATQ